MKNRAALYGQEAAELLRILSMYPGLSEKQLCRFHPGREHKTRQMLTHLKKQNRVVQSESGAYYLDADQITHADPDYPRAAWVLLDYIDRAEYHTAGEFPAKILFFAAGELYEIVCAAAGQEILLNQLLCQPQKDAGQRIVLVENREQIPLLDFPHTAGYCTVAGDGTVTYYQKRGDA